MEAPIRALKLFYCYAHEDKIFRDELDKHLTSLKRLQVLKTWYDGEIKAGAEWEQEISRHLSSAHLIVLFVSSDFIHSDYCYNIEMMRALERHEAGTARVIPIIVRPVCWQDTPVSKLQLLPAEAKPISRWPDRDDVWVEIVEQVRVIALGLQTTLKTMQEASIRDGNTLYDLKRHFNKGLVLHNLKRYEEALTAYEQAIQLDPTFVSAHYNKGLVLHNLKRYEETLTAYERAIQLDPTFVSAHNGKGHALRSPLSPTENLF